MTEEFDLLSEELSYSFISLQMHKEILKSWKKLKSLLLKEEECKDKILEFDKLLKYYFE